ncbi:hypothetical protein Rt10032_c07g3377 [Rhodotorula toruloides]|uniref:Uncharacterized protein n=1 Tax=Rhodotorula toruloides TaxID=5286 RepID=A0A511KG60_RHOTO|nr:hypothetical protein Rt10032_c07g3377 [Rhodotorula toruloides]
MESPGLSSSSSAPPPLPPTSSDGYISPDWVVPPAWPNEGCSTSPRSKRSRMASQRRTSLSTLSTASSGPSEPADSDDSDSDGYSDSSWNTEQEELEAQLQWEESVRQLQALVNLVAVPWVSRYFGRKWAYWLFERYLNIGLGKRFWLGPLSAYAPQAWR